jgi:hypothetical protein
MAGLIITEATQISPMGKGYINTPGIHSLQQVRRWRQIVHAVHAKGGHIFSGIRPLDVPLFLFSQFAGAIAATLLFRWLVPSLRKTSRECGPSPRG